MSGFNLILFTCAILLALVNDVHSKLVYQEDVQRSIGQNKVVGTWDEAKSRCEKRGAILASPIDEKLLKHMLTYMTVNNHSNPYFIGIKARYNPKPQFISAEGILVDQLPDVVLDMIDQLDPRDGDCLAMNRDSIRVVHCWERLPYICYTKSNATVEEEETEKPTEATTEATTEPATTTTEAPKETTPALPECDYDEYEYYPATGRCYKLHSRDRNFTDANVTCDDEGAYLAVVNDANEARTLGKIITDNYVYLQALWIGLIDETGKRDWRGINGEPYDSIYHFWSHIEPVPSKSPKCAIIQSDSTLYDAPCSTRLSFVCEKSL